ncbi:MAG: S8/S53 family peptidase [Spirochaetales bacterium]|nr:S8/S53 family peptidase [Spirochaetales bacterium]
MSKEPIKKLLLPILVGLFLLSIIPCWGSGNHEPLNSYSDLYDATGNCKPLPFEEIEFYKPGIFIELAHEPGILGNEKEQDLIEYLQRELEYFFSSFNYVKALYPVLRTALDWRKWDITEDEQKILNELNGRLMTKVKYGLYELDKYKYSLFKGLKIESKEIFTFEDEKSNRSYMHLSLLQNDIPDQNFLLLLLSSAFTLRNSIEPVDYILNRMFQIKGLSLNWSMTAQQWVFTGGPGGLPSPADLTELSSFKNPLESDKKPQTLSEFNSIVDSIKKPGQSAVDVYVVDTIPDRFKLRMADMSYYSVNPLYQKMRDALGIQFFMKQYNGGDAGFDSIPNEKFCNADLSDHGIFISGIVNQVNPVANIHLLEVLNKYGSGSLSSMLWGFENILQERLKTRMPFLVNCSLTTKIIPYTLNYNYRVKLIEKFTDRNWFLTLFYSLSENDILFSSMEYLFQRVAEKGGLITAAAGNDSTKSNHYPAGYPASLGQSHEAILAVGASDDKGLIASYSNSPGSKGILAYGGEYGSDHITITGNTSLYLSSSYPSTSESNKLGLAKWAGSSFSTGVVTGVLSAIMSQSSYMTPVNAKNILLSSCDLTSQNMLNLPIK